MKPSKEEEKALEKQLKVGKQGVRGGQRTVSVMLIALQSGSPVVFVHVHIVPAGLTFTSIVVYFHREVFCLLVCFLLFFVLLSEQVHQGFMGGGTFLITQYSLIIYFHREVGFCCCFFVLLSQSKLVHQGFMPPPRFQITNVYSIGS